MNIKQQKKWILKRWSLMDQETRTKSLAKYWKNVFKEEREAINAAKKIFS